MAAGSAWPQLLQTLQSTVLALNYHSDKLDVKVDLLKTLASYVAGIDKKIENLNQLITRPQTSSNYVEPTCCCSKIIESLSSLPTFLSVVVCEIKRLSSAPVPSVLAPNLSDPSDLVRELTQRKTLDKFCPAKSVTSINFPLSAVTGALEFVTEAKGASTSSLSPELEPVVPACSHFPCMPAQPALVQPTPSGADSVAQPLLSKREKKRLCKQQNSRRSQPPQGPSTNVQLLARPELQQPLQLQGVPRATLPSNSLQIEPVNVPSVGTTAQEAESPFKDHLVLAEKGNFGNVSVLVALHWGSGGPARPAVTLSVSKTVHRNTDGDVLDSSPTNSSKLPSVNRSSFPASLPPSLRTISA
ncbi:hypothetical protein NDU88_009548 [Pleurodeles waltl]|uniref:Uncharacterized protein n=1 Tax=Pleurodeles waltl TaxID=8319 RepID=A0AAV7RVJ4_PLEWA|nr:hypothetical protein NDU88_009548 [Pleurodeles waltl]